MDVGSVGGGSPLQTAQPSQQQVTQAEQQKLQVEQQTQQAAQPDPNQRVGTVVDAQV
jgi:hypothetical protein